MNKRRWVAVVIALGLFLFSGLAALVATNNESEKDTQTLTGIDALLFGQNELTESVVVPGNTMDKRIVRLSLDGTIADTGDGGLFSAETYNHQLFLEQLRSIPKDPTIKGVLLEVNSPGGGVYESAEIAREMDKIKALEIPVYVSMKNMAASGGYYISAGADKIFATPETVTGSIGVIMSGVNFSGLMEKLGIEDNTYKSGALKDAGSSTRTATGEDKQLLQNYVNSSFGRFVDVVGNGRGMSKEEVLEIADGRIYDGTQALENGLIDALGYPDDVLEALQTDQNLQDAQVFEYELSSTGFASSWLGAKVAEFRGLKMTDTNRAVKLLESLGGLDAPKPLYYYGGK